MIAPYPKSIDEAIFNFPMPVVLLKNLALIRKMDEFDPPLAAGHAMKGENNAALCLLRWVCSASANERHV